MSDRIYINLIIVLCFIIGVLFFKMGWYNQSLFESRLQYDSVRSLLLSREDAMSDLRGEIRIYEKKINECKSSNKILTNEIVLLQHKLKEFQSNPHKWIKENYKSYNLEVTAYSPTVDQCDDDPFIAASGYRVDDFTVAVSQNMRHNGWGFGKFVYIPDLNQFFKINDVMNRRYDKRIDVFKWDRKEAREFGYKELEVYLID